MSKENSKINFLFAVIAIFMVIWGVIEFGIHTLRPGAIEREDRVVESFKKTSDQIWRTHSQLQIKSTQIAQELVHFIDADSIRYSKFEKLKASEDNLIIGIYRENELKMWTDGLTDSLNQVFLYPPVLHSNLTGLYLIASSQIKLDTISWRVVTSERIYQIANPGSRFGDVYRPVSPELVAMSPAPFYLEGSLDKLPSDYRFNILTLYDETTSGHLVLNITDSSVRSYIHPNLDLAARTIFFLIISVLIYVLITISYPREDTKFRPWALLGFVWIAGFSSWWLDVVPYLCRILAGKEASEVIYENTGLLWYILLALIFSLTAVILGNQLYRLKRYYGFTWYPRTIAVSIIFGVTSAIVFGWLNVTLRFLSRLDVVEIVDLALIPGMPTIWVFLVSGMLIISILTLTFFGAWFLINSEQDQLQWVHPIVFICFNYTFYIFHTLHSATPSEYAYETGWVGLFFILTYILAWNYHRKPEYIRFYSALRAISLASLLAGIIAFPTLYSGVNEKYEKAMHNLAIATMNADAWRASGGYTIQSPNLTVVYTNGRVTRLTGDFAAGQFPDNATPPRNANRLFSTGSTHYSIEKGPHFYYREFLYRHSENTIVLIQTRLQNFNNYVYSFYRFYLHLIFLGIAFFPIVKFLSGSEIMFFRNQDRFQNRIQDTYIFSSFVFLLLLVVVTQEIIRNQNLQNIELETVENLDLLQYGLQNQEEVTAREDLFLGFDFIYYSLNSVPKAVQPELAYSLGQSSILPYDVYNHLENNQKNRFIRWIDQGGEKLLMGYRAVKPAGEPIQAVIAIPALPSAKKYMDQILQTISFLILLYLVIFGLFIVGGILISKEIMRPIHQFRKGLQRISAGQLDSVIPVTSKDEIGELANSYNLMVYKLKDLQQELAESERQIAWTEMARQVAHEIKNPLTPMKLSIQHLYNQVEYEGKNIDEVRPMIRKITHTLIQEIDSLSNIASDFSKFARPIMEQFQDVELNSVVEEVLELYRHDKRIDIYFDASEEPIDVHIAVDEFKRVLINLIKNASEAIGVTGLIIIRSFTYNTHAYLEIVDNGTGMQPEVAKKAFIPNFSTKNAGTGLGLAISKKVIDAHKGSIRFATVLGLGTTFTIAIPLPKPVHAETELEKA